MVRRCDMMQRVPKLDDSATIVDLILNQMHYTRRVYDSGASNYVFNHARKQFLPTASALWNIRRQQSITTKEMVRVHYYIGTSVLCG